MIVTAEVSLYPLKSDFESPIIEFIRILKAQKDVEVFTHSMSTFVRGESKYVFSAIEFAFESIDHNLDSASLVIKMINRSLPVEKTFLNF